MAIKYSEGSNFSLTADNTAPAIGGEAVTPSDDSADNFAAGPCRAIWVGTGGDVVAVMADTTVLTIKNVPDGYLLPVAAIRVNSTNTTADDMVALL